MSEQNFNFVTSSAYAKADDFSGPPCPICGKAVDPSSRFCSECGAFLDASGSDTLKFGEVSDDVIRELVNRSDLAENQYNTDPEHLKVRKVSLWCVAGMFGGALFSAITDSLLGVLIIVGSVVVMLKFNQKHEKPRPLEIVDAHAFQKIINRYVAPGVLSRVFDRVDQYDSEETLPLAYINEPDLIHSSYDAWGGNQLIHAQHNGIDMELSNIFLKCSHTDEDDRTTYSTVFSGPWVTFNLGIPLPAPVYVLSRRIGQRPTNNLETDNEEFNRSFYTFCSDSATAFRFLTPHVMEAILRARDIAGGKLYMVALPDGQIRIAIDSRHDLLMALDVHEPLDRIRERLENELQVPLTIVDALNSARLYQ